MRLLLRGVRRHVARMRWLADVVEGEVARDLDAQRRLRAGVDDRAALEVEHNEELLVRDHPELTAGEVLLGLERAVDLPDGAQVLGVSCVDDQHTGVRVPARGIGAAADVDVVLEIARAAFIPRFASVVPDQLEAVCVRLRRGGLRRQWPGRLGCRRAGRGGGRGRRTQGGGHRQGDQAGGERSAHTRSFYKGRRADGPDAARRGHGVLNSLARPRERHVDQYVGRGSRRLGLRRLG